MVERLGGDRVPRVRVLSGQALRRMLLERWPRRVTVVLELALRLSLVASLTL